MWPSLVDLRRLPRVRNIRTEIWGLKSSDRGWKYSMCKGPEEGEQLAWLRNRDKARWLEWSKCWQKVRLEGQRPDYEIHQILVFNLITTRNLSKCFNMKLGVGGMGREAWHNLLCIFTMEEVYLSCFPLYLIHTMVTKTILVGWINTLRDTFWEYHSGYSVENTDWKGEQDVQGRPLKGIFQN